MKEEEIKLETKPVSSGREKMGLDNMDAGFIKSPKVGETVTFVVKDVFKNHEDEMAIDPATNKQFSTFLSNVDYKVEVETSDGLTFSTNTWEVWGKMKAGFKKLNAVEGVRVRITHNLDGMARDNRGKELYKVEVAAPNTENYIVMPKPEKKVAGR